MAFANTYIFILKSVAEEESLPQAFFDNPFRLFEPIVGANDEEVAREPSNTTILDGLGSHTLTKGTVREVQANGQTFILCGIPNLNQWESWAIKEMWDDYGDLGFQCLLAHNEALGLLKTINA